MKEENPNIPDNVFATPEAAMAAYEARFDRDRLAEKLDGIPTAELDTRHEAIVAIRKILKEFTLPVQGNDGTPADVMLFYGSDSNVSPEEQTSWGNDFASRLMRFSPQKLIARISAVIESTPDGAFADTLRQELKQIAMPKVVAASVERIFGIN